jgi:hypothetical protein
MRRLYTILILSFFLTASAGLADSLELRSGKIVTGTYIKGDGDNIWIDVGGTIETFSIKEVAKLMLRSDPQTVIRSRNVGAVDDIRVPRVPGLSPPTVVTVPTGTLIGVRLTDPIVLAGSSIGRTFQATISETVLVTNQPAIPRGSNALVKLVVAKQSMFGNRTLKLDLVAVKLNGYMLFLETSRAEKRSSRLISRLATGGSIASIAIGAVAGARSGGLIGAGIGTLAGFGFEVVASHLKKKQKMPAETVLYFVLGKPVIL